MRVVRLFVWRGVPVDGTQGSPVRPRYTQGVPSAKMANPQFYVTGLQTSAIVQRVWGGKGCQLVVFPTRPTRVYHNP